jgi:D-3-phosphoglycerate dehydrogenase
MAANIKKLLLPTAMARAGWALVERREDVTGVPYRVGMPAREFHELLADAAGVALSVTPFGERELEAGPRLEVVARIGVGYDAVDVPALTRRRIPLMIAGTANSVAVAEAGIFMLMALARHGAREWDCKVRIVVIGVENHVPEIDHLGRALDAMVREGRWGDRYAEMPVELFGKNALVVGFGKIGARAAKRLAAMEMNVFVYDPYIYAETIRGIGYEPVSDLDEGVARADFITIHCPKTPETLGLFDAARIARMKKSAYLVNTARGGIIDEKALYEALKEGRIAGAGLDVFEEEPTPKDNPLLALKNFVAAPHVAGGTVEAMDRMAVATAQNLLSVLDGKPIRDNVVNKEVLG